MKDYFEIFMELFHIKHPKIILPLLFILIFGLVAYESKKYHDVLKYYPKSESQFHKIEGGWLHIDSPSNRIDLKEQNVTFAISDNHLRIDVGFPKNLFLGKVDIPSRSVLGCSFSPWGKSGVETRMILKETEKLMTLDNTDLRQWCWQNKIPKLDNGEISDWYYQGQPLPNPTPLNNNVSREDYREFGCCCN